MPFTRCSALAVLVLGVSVTPAQASIITLNYHFSVTDFFPLGPVFPDPAPVDPVTGSFSVTFDNATDLFNVTTGISITNLNIDLGSAPSFSYFALTDRFAIGGLNAGPEGVLEGTDDFALALAHVSTNPVIFGAFPFLYAQEENLDSVWVSVNVTLTPSDGAPVPEPTTLTLLGLGLGGMGVRRWRQRKA